VGEGGEDFAIEFDVRLVVEGVHEARVVDPVFAHSCVDVQDPVAAHRALLGAPVAVGILKGLVHFTDRNAVTVLRAAFEAFCKLDNFAAREISHLYYLYN